MPSATKAKKESEKSAPKFPIVCKTWAEVAEIERKYSKPVAYGPKGQPIYDFEETAKLVVFPEGVRDEE